MKLINRLLYFSAACLVALTSCAKEELESFNKYEEMALEAWMTQNRPDLVGNLQSQGGYYVDVLELGDRNAAPVNDTICWVKFDMSGRNLSGDIILSRDESDAKLSGTYTKYTHYVPYYRYCGESNTSLMEGTHLAMRNKLTLSEAYFNKYKDERGFDSREVLLREGSKVVLYMPSSIVGKGVSGDGGYEGQYSLDARRPFIVTITVRDTVKNPLESEGALVDDFCKQDGGLKIFDEKDNKRPTDPEDPKHPYNMTEMWVNPVDTVPQVYVNFRFDPKKVLSFPQSWRYQSKYEPYNAFDATEQKIAEALVKRFHPDKEYGGVKSLGDSVKLDGTAKIWYIGRFLDGFIFDTNIDEVKRIVYGEVKKAGTVLSYKPEDGKMIQAWYYSVPHMRFGQWAALITTSTNAYGSAGKNGSSSTSSANDGYSSSYLDYMNYYNYYNSYYGNNGYYGGYYGNYYDNYYGGYYGNYGYGSGYDTGTDDSSTTIKTVSTEIPPFTPLIFEIYVEPAETD